jgi:predicted PurR-regulated permease PerM
MDDRGSGEVASRNPSSAVTIQIGTRTILIVIGLVVGAYFLFRLPHFWLIVLSAAVIATALDKPVTAMQQRGLPRALGILLIDVVIVGLLVLAVLALAPIVVGDASAVRRDWPTYLSHIETMVEGVLPLPFDRSGISPDDLQQAVQTYAGSLARGVTELGLTLGRSAFYIFVTLVVAFFLAVEPGVIVRHLEQFIPPAHRPRVARVARSIHQRIGDWARGQLLIAVIFGAMMGIGLRLLGIPYAWSLGVVAGILEIVPYVGGAITVILAVVSAATVGVPQMISVVILYIVLVNIQSHILAPLLYGMALGLPPVAILLALLAGVELLGILGALLAVPLTVIVWAIVEEFAPQPGDSGPRPTSMLEERVREGRDG